MSSTCFVLSCSGQFYPSPPTQPYGKQRNRNKECGKATSPTGHQHDKNVFVEEMGILGGEHWANGGSAFSQIEKLKARQKSDGEI